jgi:hypothetical protein
MSIRQIAGLAGTRRKLTPAMTTMAALAVASIVLCTNPGCQRESGKVEQDLTTPRSAALIFTRALESGDADTAKNAVYGSGMELEWVEAMAAAMSGMRQLVAAAEKQFGPAAYTLVAGRRTLRISGALANAEVQMNGDRATVIPSGGEDTKLPMKRIEGNWKVDIGMLTRGEDIGGIVKQLRAVGATAPRLTKDVEAGKFKGVNEVQRAMALVGCKGRDLSRPLGVRVAKEAGAAAHATG